MLIIDTGFIFTQSTCGTTFSSKWSQTIIDMQTPLDLAGALQIHPCNL